MQPTPLRGPEIVGILESHFVLTLVPFYKAARLMGKPLGGLCPRLPLAIMPFQVVLTTVLHHSRGRIYMLGMRLWKIAVVSALALMIFGSWLFIWPEIYSRWISQVPDYPHPQYISTQSQTNGPYQFTTIVFETTDAPSSIRQFYLATLPQYGWVINRPSPDTTDQLVFSLDIPRTARALVSQMPYTTDSYRFTISMRPIDSRTTRVILEHERMPGGFQETPQPLPGLP